MRNPRHAANAAYDKPPDANLPRRPWRSAQQAPIRVPSGFSTSALGATTSIARPLPFFRGRLRRSKRGIFRMKRFLMVALALSLSQQTTRAAEISVIENETPDHPALILIKGPFLKDEGRKDVGTFVGLVAARKKPAVVFLDGPGGAAWTGLQIGRLIRRYGCLTAVADNVQCTSACALAWLGGKERYMGTNARIGFHAASVTDNSDASASAAANAVIGAYLHEVGVTDFNAIIYLTKADPQSITWLNLSDAMRYRISVKAFSPSQGRWSWTRSALGLPSRRHVDSIEAMSESKPKFP